MGTSNLKVLGEQELRSINGGDMGLFFFGLFVGLIGAIVHRARRQREQ